MDENGKPLSRIVPRNDRFFFGRFVNMFVFKMTSNRVLFLNKADMGNEAYQFLTMDPHTI